MIPEGSITLTSSEECRTDWGRNRWTFCLHGWCKFRSCGQQCNATWGQTSYRILSWWSQRFLSQWHTFPWLRMLYRLHAVACPLYQSIQGENTAHADKNQFFTFCLAHLKEVQSKQWANGSTEITWHVCVLDHSFLVISNFCPFFNFGHDRRLPEVTI